MRTAPEVLAPAGNLEKLKVAVLYGADAVYLGGQKFGLRMASENFSYDEILEGVAFAHEHGSKVFVVLNGFLHDKDLDEIPEFLELLEVAKVDAVIVSDLGVISTVKKHSNLEIHLSTQASCLNVEAAKFWKDQGVKRVVLGREVSLTEAKKIKKETGIEVEMFIHGSMCMAYSGNCVISNYTQGRDSNRGGCAHSCRFGYEMDFSSVDESKIQKIQSYFMSSKDLEGIRLIPEFFEAGIDSLKVEGRMKSPHYAGTISKVYREAVDFFHLEGHYNTEKIFEWEKELRKISHRDYTSASLISPADESSIYDERENEIKDYQVVGVMQEVVQNEFCLVEVRAAFFPGDTLEVLPYKGSVKTGDISFISDMLGRNVEKTKPGTLVKIPWIEGVDKLNLIRRKITS
ncbi:MAG: U32 family peptidase C-terminal domain-containing protein [Bacteriovoracaceae bacterium]|nr:U32 family peptidase C-terminal domain-containing protein [Bacteriovoracaceae bacterium]